MNTNHTDITIILDRSISMAPVTKETLAGFNKFLDEQKKAQGTATLTLHQFDHEHETPIKAQDVRHIAPITSETYVPRGNTALLDAMGRAITETGRRLDAMPERDRPSKVVVVVITDGEENSSREFTRPRVMALIKHQQDKYSWEFVFMGANQDAIQAGVNYGFMAAKSMSYAANTAGVTDSFGSIASNVGAFRSGLKCSMTFEASDYEKQAKAGAKTK